MDKLIKKNNKRKQNIGVIFDETERKDYLSSFYGKKKLQKNFGKKREEQFKKDVIKEKRKLNREV